MLIKTFVVGAFGCNCTVLADERTRGAIVVDPGGDIEKILPFLRQHQLDLKMSIHTHAHLDHVGGTRAIKEQTGAQIMLHKGDEWLYDNLQMQADLFGWKLDPTLPVDHWLEHDETLDCDPLTIDVIHTPGHTPGSLCFLVAGHSLLFTGDTLFEGSVGRTDLWGGSHPQLMDSIHGRLMGLDENLTVIPGHGPTTTIGHEKRTNPFLLESRG